MPIHQLCMGWPTGGKGGYNFFQIISYCCCQSSKRFMTVRRLPHIPSVHSGSSSGGSITVPCLEAKTDESPTPEGWESHPLRAENLTLCKKGSPFFHTKNHKNHLQVVGCWRFSGSKYLNRFHEWSNPDPLAIRIQFLGLFLFCTSKFFMDAISIVGWNGKKELWGMVRSHLSKSTKSRKKHESC